MMLSAGEEMRHDVVVVGTFSCQTLATQKVQVLSANYLEVYNPRRLFVKLCIHLLVDP